MGARGIGARGARKGQRPAGIVTGPAAAGATVRGRSGLACGTDHVRIRKTFIVAATLIECTSQRTARVSARTAPGLALLPAARVGLAPVDFLPLSPGPLLLAERSSARPSVARLGERSPKYQMPAMFPAPSYVKPLCVNEPPPL